MAKLKTIAGVSALAAAASLGIVGILLGIVFIAGIPALLGGLIGWLLWNHALADLFHQPHIGYWACVSILWLAAVVTGLLRRVLS